jgi:2-keto-4-pentenoate hydratase
MVGDVDVESIADRLVDAYENASMLDPVSATAVGFDSATAYAVLDHIASLRVRAGWKRVGRKIGFTNQTIWDRYGVDRPMWAHMWSDTVVMATNNEVSVSLDRLVQPRIEPEVVFKLRTGLAGADRSADVLGAVEWMAPGFEIVQCHFPDWDFTIEDCTADFGLHGALVVGMPVPFEHEHDQDIAAVLQTFALTLSRDGAVVDRGVGANVLGSPLHALAHLIRVLADQPEYAPLAAGEIVTTGTLTDAWPIAPGERWQSDYGSLGLDGLTATFS